MHIAKMFTMENEAQESLTLIFEEAFPSDGASMQIVVAVRTDVGAVRWELADTECFAEFGELLRKAADYFNPDAKGAVLHSDKPENETISRKMETGSEETVRVYANRLRKGDILDSEDVAVTMLARPEPGYVLFRCEDDEGGGWRSLNEDDLVTVRRKR